MISEVSKALKGYAVRQVQLEAFVDNSGYQQVIHTLVELNLSAPELITPSDQFVGALSPKSLGLMMTSALMTGNEALFRPLSDSVQGHLEQIYAQDLPSMLGGSYAPLALAEMARRSFVDTNNLEKFNLGISQVAAIAVNDALSAEREAISNASWVESHPDQSRELLTIVNATPESLDIPQLKSNALSRFLKAGLKLGLAAGAIAGIGLAGLYGASFNHISADAGIVDLNKRPTIAAKDSQGNIQHRKIVMYGEIGSVELAKYYIDKALGKDISDTLDTFTDHSRQGVASLVKGGAGGLDVCVIKSHQTAAVSVDGNFLLPDDAQYLFHDRNLQSFYFESHEASHCFNNYVEKSDLARLSGYESYYAISLNEISSDLGAILDYMRITGTSDLYTDHIRPQRVTSADDLNHKTAWALDEVLKDINPAVIHMKSKEEIPQLTRMLMEKHFMAKDGTFVPRNLGSELETEIGTPASNALLQEIIASRFLEHMAQVGSSISRYPELTSKLKTDIENTLSAHYAKYVNIAPQEVVSRVEASYARVAAHFKLRPLQEMQAPAAKISGKLDSMVTAFTGPR